MANTTTYPLKARSLMRFQAQNGQFTLNAEQVVTVIGPTQGAAEWLDVIDEHGASGSIPDGFIIPIEQETIQETEHPAQPTPPTTTSNPIRNASNPTVEALPTPPITSHVLASSQGESVPPSKGPPPPITKSNALRDRIAMFNKVGPTAAASPPSSIRPKPPMARKPINFPAPVPPIETSQENLVTPSVSRDDPQSISQPGMSAADAEESVKASGSLKDRIRLLQQQQAVGPDTSSDPPKPKREWKRPPAPPVDELALPIPIGLPPTIQHEATTQEEKSFIHPVTETVPNVNADKPDPTGSEKEQVIEEEDEEEAELERRRRIAERMAKLGGSKMGFGFPGLNLAPKPTVSSKHYIDEEASIQPSKEELNLTVDELSSSLPPDRITMPSIPKRAPPPRRKAPSPANVPAPPDALLVSDAAPVSEPVPDAAPVSELVPDAAPVSEPVADVAHVSEPVADAAPTSEPVSDAALTSEPVSDAAPISEPVSDSAPVSELVSKIEVPSLADDLINSYAPLKDAIQPIQPTTTHIPGQPLDLTTEATDMDQLPEPSSQNAPSPVDYEPLEESDQLTTSSNDPDSPPQNDTLIQEINEDELINVLPTEPNPDTLLDVPQDEIDQVPIQEITIDRPVNKETASSESKEDVIQAVEGEEDGEEEEELARRRRIAERMAKLGGAKIGFGFPGVAPVIASKPTKQASNTSEVLPTKQSPRELISVEDLQISSPPIMPTRAAPPTRKAPSPANVAPVLDQGLTEEDQLGNFPDEHLPSFVEHSTPGALPTQPNRLPPVMNSDHELNNQISFT